ncbi:MAG: hypothetical protein JEZ07_19040 [Phycisphaerae bacterium]|nr:hypothetical protein [Phycisphaerae bacterium]
MSSQDFSEMVKIGKSVVGIQNASQDPDEPNPSPFSPSYKEYPGSGSRSGCSSCQQGGSSPNRLTYKGMEFTASSKESNALGNSCVNSGSDISINISGRYRKVSSLKGWTIGSSQEQTRDATPTAVTATKVTDPLGKEYYYHIPYDASSKAMLCKVIYTAGSTNKTITYNYDSSNPDTLLSQQNGSDKIEYNYDLSGVLDEAGILPNGDSAYSRKISLTYNADKKLESLTCSSCGTSERDYTYTDSERIYWDAGNTQTVPAKQYLQSVKNSSGNTLAYYTYSYDDLYSLKRGDYPNDKFITKYVYHTTYTTRKDYVNGTYYLATRYNYTDYDTDRTITSIVRYHDLQSATGEAFTGTSSTTSYSYDDVDGTVRDYDYDNADLDDDPDTGEDSIAWQITTLPSGIKLIKEYDVDTGQLVRNLKQSNDATPVTITLGEYLYTEHTSGSDSRYLLDIQTNKFGGETDYTYDTTTLKQVKVQSPLPTTGVSVPTTRPDSRTEYDSTVTNRVKYQYHKTPSGSWLGSEYIYDDYGNLTMLINDVVFTLTSDVVSSWDYTDSTATEYTFDDYGQQKETATVLVNATTGAKITGSKINIRKTIYNDEGVVIGRASLLDDSTVISATKYSYDNEGRLVIESVLDVDDTITLASLQTDLDLALKVDSDKVCDDDDTDGIADAVDLTNHWVHTIHVFDTFNKTYTIADADEETGTSNVCLKTQYKYNLQDQIVAVISPSGNVAGTIRNGRGQVKYQIQSNDDIVTAGGDDIDDSIADWYSGTFATGEIVTQYFYTADGDLDYKLEPHPDGSTSKVKTIYGYDGFGRLTDTHKEVQ